MSIEHDKEWHDRTNRSISEQSLTNVECRYVPLDHPIDEPAKNYYERQPRYVAVTDEFEDSSLDFVVVDGPYRGTCIIACLPKLRAGGYLLVDNTNWLPALSEWPVPLDWPVVHQSKNVMTQTTIWQKPA